MRAGQVRGLEALLRDHGSRVKGILGVTFRRPEGDHALEDAVCNASLGMWKRARKLDPGGNLGGYFYVAARRELVRILKLEKQWHPPLWDGAAEQVPATGGGEAGGGEAAGGSAAGLFSERVRRVLDALPLAEREILSLDYANGFGLKGQEIAQILGTTYQTVYSLRNRTKGKLERLLPVELPKAGQPPKAGQQ